MEEYEKTQASIKLMTALAQGEKSGEEKGWFSLNEVETELGLKNE